MDWFTYDKIRQCRIIVFDDGNEKYEEKYDNLWDVIATNNRGKYKIMNKKEQEMILGSISCWKVEIVN
jgi:hypothetical protein